MESFFRLFGDNRILMGIVGAFITGFATGIGALPVLFTSKVSDRLLDALLGFAARVMLAATAFSLIVPAIELGGIWPAVFGILVGALFLAALDHLLPHTHLIKGAWGPSSHLRDDVLWITCLYSTERPWG